MTLGGSGAGLDVGAGDGSVVGAGAGSVVGSGAALLLGAASLAAGRLYKTFVRVSARKEPRNHSKLEGQTILASELWDIGGTLAYGPNDPVLPLRERIFCGHANLYHVG